MRGEGNLQALSSGEATFRRLDILRGLGKSLLRCFQGLANRVKGQGSREAFLQMFDLIFRQVFQAKHLVAGVFICRISSSSLSCIAVVSRFCVFWIRNTMRKVMIVVPVLMSKRPALDV